VLAHHVVDIDVGVDRGVLLQVPMSIVPGPDMSKISLSSRCVMTLTASPIIGYSVTPRWKNGLPVSLPLISPSMSSAPTANSSRASPWPPFGSTAILVMTPMTSALSARILKICRRSRGCRLRRRRESAPAPARR
jgi:hypothetical protein